ncbi:hypothetical protein G9274_003503 [Stenotrophomonas rhizophila]|nr:hypothetical protein G9274_003503 [Stenotrophomonas rhizophila]
MPPFGSGVGGPALGARATLDPVKPARVVSTWTVPRRDTGAYAGERAAIHSSQDAASTDPAG